MSDQTFNPAALGALARGELENFVVAATPGGILRQEAQGQADLVAGVDRLPSDMGDGGHAIAEACGFTIGEPIDEIFVSVTAPAGWRLRPTDHSMHSELLDDQGRVRAGVFYKAAFYDRRADLTWARRFEVVEDYNDDRSVVTRACDTTTGRVLFEQTSPRLPGQPADLAFYETLRQARADAEAALDSERPDWQDPVAYWDEPAPE